MLLQELGPLEAFGKRLADRLLDDARTREADQRPWFGQRHVAEHGEGGRHAARRRVGEDRDVRHARGAEARERGRDLAHLHQGENSLLHARAARGRDDDERRPLDERHLGGAGQDLAHDGAHRAPHEGVIEDRDDRRDVVDQALRRQDGVRPAGLRLGLLQAVAVAFAVLELQGIGRADLGEERLPAPVPEEQPEALDRRKAEVESALRTHAQVALHFLDVERLLAPVALQKETLAQRGRRLRIPWDPGGFVLSEPHGVNRGS